MRVCSARGGVKRQIRPKVAQRERSVRLRVVLKKMDRHTPEAASRPGRETAANQMLVQKVVMTSIVLELERFTVAFP